MSDVAKLKDDPLRKDRSSCELESPSAAEVTNRSARSGPPKVHAVGCRTGRSIEWHRTACGVKRRSRLLSQSTSQRCPSASTVSPSGLPSISAKVSRLPLVTSRTAIVPSRTAIVST